MTTCVVPTMPTEMPAETPAMPTAAPEEAARKTVKRARKDMTPKPEGPAVAEPATGPARRGTRSKSATPPAESATPETGAATSATSATSATAENTGTGWLIVAKSVRQLLKNLPNGVHCGADALPAVNAKLHCILIEAATRAHENGRKTLKASDL
jgi:hypothetical protein